MHNSLWGLLLALVACNDAPGDGSRRPLPDETLVERPAQYLPPALSPAAFDMQAAILETTARDSLIRFARLADANAGFASNFAGINHYDHWSLLRHTGVDPLREIEALFKHRYAKRQIGSEIWFIWPDFAAMSPQELMPERLSFQDKARLEALIGQSGLAQIRAGSAYPGFRTAIGENGRWVYYLHEIGESE